MVGGVSSAASQLSSLYNSGSQDLASTLTRIASGKKFQNATDDFIGYLRSTKLTSEINGYQKVKEDLTEFKTYTSAAVQSGQTIYDDLNKLKDLAKKYGATTDTDLQSQYKAEFDSLVTQIGNSFTYGTVDGQNLLQTTADVSSVDLNPEGGNTLTMRFTGIASSTNIAAFEIDGTDIATGIDTEITNMQTYLMDAKRFDNIASQQQKFVDTVITSKEAVKSVITDIDDAAESAKMADQTVRQQAAISMIAQANMSRQSMLQLFM